MFISVVIPTYNPKHAILLGALVVLFSQAHGDCEIAMVDNNSSMAMLPSELIGVCVYAWFA